MKWFIFFLIVGLSHTLAAPASYQKFKEKKKVFTVGPLKIDKIYRSMAGPQASLKKLDFDLDPKISKNIWITRFRAEVLDLKNKNESQEFMCHLTIQSLAEDTLNTTLGIAQGQKEIIFPRGYAIRMANASQYPINIDGQVLNNNYPNINKEVYFKVTVYYLDDQAAKSLGLKPLKMKFFGGLCPNGSCEPVYPDQDYHEHKGKKHTGHWLVPPGRHDYPAMQTGKMGIQENINVHYIWMHLHPFGESMTLKNKTTGKVIWTGKANTKKDRAVLSDTDHYSSSKGITLIKDHQYELTTTYNNKTQKKVDAMGLLYMYYVDESFSF